MSSPIQTPVEKTIKMPVDLRNQLMTLMNEEIIDVQWNHLSPEEKSVWHIIFPIRDTHNISIYGKLWQASYNLKMNIAQPHNDEKIPVELTESCATKWHRSSPEEKAVWRAIFSNFDCYPLYH
jgi:hypothetical protein